MPVLVVLCALVGLCTLSVAWLALEVRLLRCGHVAPALVKIIPPLARMKTFHVGHPHGESLKDYA